MLKGGLVLIWELDMNLGPTLLYNQLIYLAELMWIIIMIIAIALFENSSSFILNDDIIH